MIISKFYSTFQNPHYYYYYTAVDERLAAMTIFGLLLFLYCDWVSNSRYFYYGFVVSLGTALFFIVPILYFVKNVSISIFMQPWFINKINCIDLNITGLVGKSLTIKSLIVGTEFIKFLLLIMTFYICQHENYGFSWKRFYFLIVFNSQTC